MFHTLLSRGFKEKLSELIGESSTSDIPRSFDVVGNIAVIKIPESLIQYKQSVAEALMSINRQVGTVLVQTGPVDGTLRLRNLTWAGGRRTWNTVHKEHGCRFEVDLRKVYFSPRLSHERMRIAQQVRPDEIVVNMFGGVGSFSIVIAKNSKVGRVFSIDINSDAWRFTKRNVLVNKVEDRVKVLLGDAVKIVPSVLDEMADRILLPLPMLSEQSLRVAIEGLKPEGGIIHHYTHLYAGKNEDPVKKAWMKVQSTLSNGGFLIGLREGRKVRSIGPRQCQVVLDIEVQE